MDPGGVLIVHDFFLDESGDGPFFPALFSLNMLANSGQGRTYTEPEVRGMLEKAGLVRIERLDYTGPSESGVLLSAAPA
jgi:hypothetical protein